MKNQEERAHEAEQDAKRNRMKINDLEEEVKTLRAQTEKQQNVDEQVNAWEMRIQKEF